MVALILSKLVRTIVTVLPSEIAAYHWTDSMSALYGYITTRLGNSMSVLE